MFYISTGARASELLGIPQGLVVPEEQVIGVIRKGSRALQQLPASADAFVWLRLYQQEMRDLVPKGPDEALWWTLRRPFRPLEYDAARMVFNKANATLGANWTLHDLSHSAAKRILRDPHLTLADVQWILGRPHHHHADLHRSYPGRGHLPRAGPPRAATHTAGTATGTARPRLPARSTRYVVRHPGHR